MKGFNWNNLAERGKLECLIKKRIDRLKYSDSLFNKILCLFIIIL